MAKTFLLEIVTPQRVLLSEEVTEVICPGTDGEFGVLPNHSYLLTSLNPGVIIYKKDGEKTVVAGGGGFAEVGPEKTTLLVDNGVFASELDLDETKKALEEANEALGGLTLQDPEYLNAYAAQKTAEVKLRATEIANS